MPTTITTTSSHFVTFLALSPWSTKFSNSNEAQVILASIPLLVVGSAGLGFLGFQLSLGRMSRPFLDLSLSTLFAFLAGVFQLVNVLQAEFEGSSFLGRGLLIAEAVGMTGFISFKLQFLYHQTQQPSLNECFEPKEKVVSDKSSSKNEINQEAWNSGSYQRWGKSFGNFVKLVIFVSVVIVTLLAAIWRLGISTDLETFLPIYTASNISEVVLLAFFAFKFSSNAYLVETLPRKSNFIDVFPFLLGISFGIANSVLALVPGLLFFTETPLGRFLRLVETYIFLLTLAIEDHRRPFNESLFTTAEIVAQSVLPRYINSIKSPTQHKLPSDLPERIIIRRSSRVPSWLPRRNLDDLSEQQSLTHDSDLPGRSDQVASLIDFDLYYDSEDAYLAPPDALGNLNFGRNSIAFPESIHQSEKSFRRSSIPATRNEAKRISKRIIHTRNLSIGRFDKKTGIRLSSPNIDQLSFGDIMKRQQEIEVGERLVGGKSIQRMSATSFKNLPSLPSTPQGPRPIPVPRGIGIDTSFYMPSPRKETLLNPSSLSRHNTTDSNASGLSLSTFPIPPTTTREGTQPLRTFRSASPPPRPDTVVTQGTEFEIFPQLKKVVERKRYHEAGENLGIRRGLNSNINITSLIIGASPTEFPSTSLLSPSSSFDIDPLDSRTPSPPSPVVEKYDPSMAFERPRPAPLVMKKWKVV